ncbi:MAG TPA: hypothetical protein VM451_00900 [Candidatus Limnocylindria bacterium]|nr:hypothetical protein [Candidatus Limnocylindria bacterium]
MTIAVGNQTAVGQAPKVARRRLGTHRVGGVNVPGGRDPAA